MASVEIDGAELFEFPGDALVRRLTLQSVDRRRLAVVSEGEDGLFRVYLYARATDPQYGRTFWGRAEDPSLTDSLAAAEDLARARLERGDG